MASTLWDRIRQWFTGSPGVEPPGAVEPSHIPFIPPQFTGGGAYEFETVGESHYQSTLRVVSAPLTHESKAEEIWAELALDNGNPYDELAVAVQIRGAKVAHLSRADARRFRRAILSHGVPGDCWQIPALLTGGWSRGFLDRGDIGVRLDLVIPRAPRKPRAQSKAEQVSAADSEDVV